MRGALKAAVVIGLIGIVAALALASVSSARKVRTPLKISYNYAERQTFSPIAVLIGVKTQSPVRYTNFYVGGERLIASPTCGSLDQRCDEWQAIALAAPSATSITFTSEVYNKPAGKRKSLTTKVALKGLERGVTKPPLKKKRRR